MRRGKSLKDYVNFREFLLTKSHLFECVIIFFLISTSVGIATAGVTSKHSNNEVILAATSPFEDLTEMAMMRDDKGMSAALATYDKQAARVKEVLQERTSHQLDSIVATIKEARRHSDCQSVALNSMEAYKILVTSLDTKALRIPAEVYLLDYVGFRTQALLRFEAPDWALVASTAGEAKDLWSKVEPKVKHKGLLDAVGTVIKGMEEAANNRNTDMAVFAAQVDLDLIDLLEDYFDSPAGKK